ncbi:MAG: cytochrome c [Gemmatimonadaceae bacterium]|nr:cytochrome c [Gemmatimonadaceae bacterium]
MNADLRRAAPALPLLTLVVVLGACSWFTDFRDQPRYEPWESDNDSTPFRANPQLSVPLHGMAAPGLVVSYRPALPVIDSVAALVGPNPMPVDLRSLENGRKSYQINCSVCHGVTGKGFVEAAVGQQYGMYAPPVATGTARGLSDGQIFGIIRNGRGNMATYNRIPDEERWDIINYIRGMQGRHQVVMAPAGVPGETGATLPAATSMAPTRPAPYYNRIGSQAGIDLGIRGAQPTSGVRADSTGIITPATGPAAGPPVVVRTAPDSVTASTDTTRGRRP